MDNSFRTVPGFRQYDIEITGINQEIMDARRAKLRELMRRLAYSGRTSDT